MPDGDPDPCGLLDPDCEADKLGDVRSSVTSDDVSVIAAVVLRAAP